MKKIYLLLLLTISLLGVKAQDPLSPKEKISQVMQSEENFLYADQTCATVEQAMERARAILMHEVDAYLKQSGEDEEVVKGIVTEKMVTLTVQRGDKYRAFVYINKANLSAANRETKIEVVTIPEKPLQMETTPAQDTPSVQETPPEKPVEIVTPVSEDNVLGQISAMTSRLQVYDYICLLQKDGEKISFFEHPNANEQGDMYLILYKRGGKIEAILTPADDQGNRFNLVTGQPDSKNNYPSTSVNGFIYNK